MRETSGPGRASPSSFDRGFCSCSQLRRWSVLWGGGKIEGRPVARAADSYRKDAGVPIVLFRSFYTAGA
jgi:hypothetical protein